MVTDSEVDRLCEERLAEQEEEDRKQNAENEVLAELARQLCILWCKIPYKYLAKKNFVVRQHLLIQYDEVTPEFIGVVSKM